MLGNFGQANYGAAKTGLVGLMNVLKQEGARYNVKVNTVAPVARTRMTEELLGPVADRLDPEAVAPVVAYFCSEDCVPSGDIWSVAGGNVSRFFIGRTPGYFKHPGREGLLTLEDVASHVDAIRAEAGYTVPGSVQEELQAMAPLLLS